MAGTSEDLNDDTITVDGVTVLDAPANEEAVELEPGEVVGEAVEVDSAEEPGEVVVTLGDEPPPTEEEDTASAPQWLKDLRKKNREMVRALREKDAELARLKGGAAQPDAPVLGPKPTLASCDFDEAVFEEKLDAWHSTKLKVDEQNRKQEEAKRAQQAAWEKKLAAFDEAKAKLRVPDFDEADAVVDDALSVVQRGILIDCPKSAEISAALKYALGKNPAKLKELAAIENPAHFTWALSKLDDKLKVEPRRAAPPPERVVRGSGSLAGTTDKTLDALRAEADKTGDRSKVAKYLREKQRA